jgi:hypothetical protein
VLAGARLLEYVGVTAYTGAVHLIGNADVLTKASTIATIESRHQTIFNLLSGQSPIPQPFDISLNPNEVATLAGPLISGCDLGIRRRLSHCRLLTSAIY